MYGTIWRENDTKHWKSARGKSGTGGYGKVDVLEAYRLARPGAFIAKSVFSDSIAQSLTTLWNLASKYANDTQPGHNAELAAVR
jgi:hypothetical protein